MLDVITHFLKRLPYIVVLILVTGCVTIPPTKHEYKSHENFPVSLNKVWNLSSNFLAEKVAAIDTADKKSGFLKTKEFNVPYEGFQYKSIYADCGELAGLYVYRKIIGHYDIFISESEDNRTTLRTFPHYRASLWLENNFKGWVQCQSRGYVEKLLINNIWANIRKSLPEKALIPQPKNGMDKESERMPAVLILKSQEHDTNSQAIAETHEEEIVTESTEYEGNPPAEIEESDEDQLVEPDEYEEDQPAEIERY